MTKTGIIYLSRAALALLFILLLIPSSYANDPDWPRRRALIQKQLGIDPAEAARGYKILTPDEAIIQCFESQRKIALNQRIFPKDDDPYNFIIKHTLPKLYAKSKNVDFKLGALNLNQMFNRFKEIRVCENQYGAPIQADENRTTYPYLTEQKFVILNPQFMTSPYQSKQEIMIHVFLGAAGYEDNQYALTNALLMAEKSLAPHILAMFPQTEAQIYRTATARTLPKSMPPPRLASEKPMMVAGGFTGGIGGGSGPAALIKRALLDLAPQISAYTKRHDLVCQHAWSNQATYIQDIQVLPIEENSNMIERYQRNPNGGYFIRISTYTSDSTGDITAKMHLGMIFSIINDYCTVKYSEYGKYSNNGTKDGGR